MEPRISVRTETLNSIVILSIDGDVTLMSAQQLEPHFDGFYRNRNARALILDLDGVGYIDSSGLAAFVEVLKKCLPLKRTLILHSVSQTVYNVLEISNLDTLFNIQDDLAAALAQVGDDG